MPEVDGNNPGVRAGDYINLVPCCTVDESDPSIAHAYRADQMVQGTKVAMLGWMTLAEARRTYQDVSYAIRRGSHDICAACVEIKFAD